MAPHDLLRLLDKLEELIRAENCAREGSQRDAADLAYADLISGWSVEDIAALRSTETELREALKDALPYLKQFAMMIEATPHAAIRPLIARVEEAAEAALSKAVPS